MKYVITRKASQKVVHNLIKGIRTCYEGFWLRTGYNYTENIFSKTIDIKLLGIDCIVLKFFKHIYLFL